MTKQEQVKKQLEEQVEKVKQRLQVLDMIEERLFMIRDLAQRVIDEDLRDEEIQNISQQVKHLEEQVILFEKDNTQVC